MKKSFIIQHLLLLMAFCLAGNTATAQENLTSRLTYSARITFQAYGLPFQNLGKSLRHAGTALDIGVPLNKTHTLQQTLTVGYQGHRQHETGIYVHTQFNYRPLLFQALEPSVGIGVGRIISHSNPGNRYYELENSTWKKSSKQTQSHWLAPISLALGYRTTLSNGHTVTPFVGYEFMPIINYNSAFVALPTSLLSVGTRFNFQNRLHTDKLLK